MPANPKYLSSTGQRILKVSAGVVGGYLLSGSIHLVLALIPRMGMNILISGVFSMFFLWILFMIIAFLARNGWIVWAVYLFSTGVLGGFAYMYSGGGAV